MTEINIEAAPRASFPVRLVGVEYTITPPKTALALRIARRAKTAKDKMEVLTLLDGWMLKAFGPEKHKEVMARLEDEDDDLDFEHLTALLRAVIEKTAGGNPTT